MASKLVAEAIAKYLEGRGDASNADRFYPVPNRVMRRAMRFGGSRQLIPGANGKPATFYQPQRSRIQRGISRPGVRGKVLTEGLTPIFVSEDGDRMDMREFYDKAAA
ncbi:hypothetical protein J4U00_gp058 [Mycobacterium phage DyoEdafos]|uniref:Uncharacterized protein n=1 Tax=Mycobacterium phage DyoEdafos TaxID=2599860 RepID=A0A5J6TJY1_9CAUD|nr:hypothetical protein J4U00_gp058 [Mycobacterium phage DyoEdafos]QFG10287.1 hypothetical protein SEA_DYOEDAFOS_58 [Mycobacterium phage DyoEdafos]